MPELVRVRSPLEEEYGTSHQPLHTCGVHSLASSPSLLLVTCPRELPAEQAAAWARGVLRELRPRTAVVAATLPAMNYRGAQDPADDDLVFSLQTSVAAAAAPSGGAPTPALPPPLPEATLLGGLPAALLERCELAGVPATAVVGVKAQQVPDAQFLQSLAAGLAAALAASGSDGAAALAAALVQRPRSEALAALGTVADAVYRSSASSSIFT